MYKDPQVEQRKKCILTCIYIYNMSNVKNKKKRGKI